MLKADISNIQKTVVFDLYINILILSLHIKSYNYRCIISFLFRISYIYNICFSNETDQGQTVHHPKSDLLEPEYSISRNTWSHQKIR